MEHFVKTFAQHGYLAVFVLMALESACIPIPSEVTMLFAGALSSTAVIATGAPHLNLVVVIVVGSLANLVGSLAAYGLGRVIGIDPIVKYGKYVLIRAHDVEKAQRWWNKHGQGAVFFSRMLPVIRTFISLPAGLAEMPIGRFTLYTAAGVVPWVAALGIAGYALGANWDTVIHSFNLATYAIVGALLGTFGFYIIRRRRSQVRA